MKRRGFTLIELLVVVAILGILVALGVKAMQKARAASAAAAPVLRGPINDDAKILTEEQVKNLSDILLKYEKATTNQVVVLTVPTLDGRDISQFTLETFISWKLGQKDKDNGVLFVAAMKEHKTWITTGRGVGDRLTDVFCRRVLADKVKPAFKAGDYAGGIYAAITAIEVQLGGQVEGAAPPPGAPAPAPAAAEAPSFWSTWPGIVIIIVFVLILLVFAAASNSGSLPSGGSSSSRRSSGGGGGGGGGGGYSGGGGDSGGGGAGGGW